MPDRQPLQGEVWWLDPDPTRGREQAKSRPFAIVSVDQLNRSGVALSLAVPFTRTNFGNSLHLKVEPPEADLDATCFAMPEQLRSVSHDRLGKRLGTLRPRTLEQLLTRSRLLLRTP